MPPIRSQSSRNSIEREGRILLAIKAFEDQEISVIRDVARRSKVPKSTLQPRLSGTTFRAKTRANSHRLTNLEEESVKKNRSSL